MAGMRQSEAMNPTGSWILIQIYFIQNVWMHNPAFLFKSAIDTVFRLKMFNPSTELLCTWIQF